MISKEEIETFRKPSEYIQWFESHLETTGHDRAFREAILQHKGIFKQFYEELFPLYSLLKHKQEKWNESRFRNVLGNQPYDVEIENHRMAYLEIGTTEFDEVELFRMREFLDKGYVSLIGKVARDDRNKPISVQDEMRSYAEIVQETVDSVSARIECKSAKKDYPAKTGLLVYYDDYIIGYNQEDIGLLQSAVDRLKPKWKGTFDTVYLVGPRGDILIEATK
jgi:hypothetical protein